LPAQLVQLLRLTSDLEKDQRSQPFAWALYLQLQKKHSVLKNPNQQKPTGRRGGGGGGNDSSRSAVKLQLKNIINQRGSADLEELAQQICQDDCALAHVMFEELDRFQGDSGAASINLVELLFNQSSRRWRDRKGVPKVRPSKMFVWCGGRAAATLAQSVMEFHVETRIAALAAAAQAAAADADAAAAAAPAASSAGGRSRRKQAVRAESPSETTTSSRSSEPSEPAAAADTRSQRAKKRARSVAAAAVDQPSAKAQRTECDQAI